MSPLACCLLLVWREELLLLLLLVVHQEVAELRDILLIVGLDIRG